MGFLRSPVAPVVVFEVTLDGPECLVRLVHKPPPKYAKGDERNGVLVLEASTGCDAMGARVWRQIAPNNDCIDENVLARIFFAGVGQSS